MAVNAQNIKLGVCDVTYKGVDLGATKGGVEVEVKTETHEVKIDQYGETPIKEIIMGTMVTVKVPLAEADLVKLQSMIPQSTAINASGSLPSGRTVQANVAAGQTQFTQSGSGGGAIAPGMHLTFAGHLTRYIVTAVDVNLISIRPLNGATGLQAPITASEAITFYANTAGIEVRSGVNTDLVTGAGVLFLHPTGLSVGDTSQDFTVHKCSPVPNFTFKYEHNNERVFEVTFKGYADTNNNGRIATFGSPTG